MALDQNVTPSAAETAKSPAIENELPAYRAISPHAVLALICGLLAFLSFTDWFFLVFAVAAVALGVYADARIRRDPEIWTGRRLAQAGTALGLIFGLSSVTNAVVQDLVRTRMAGQFARQYVDVLKKGTLADAIWYTATPAGREQKPADEMYKELKANPDPMSMQMSFGGLLGLKERLDAGPEQDVHFVKIEASGVEGLDTFASALLEVHGPPTAKYTEKEQFALLVLKGRSHKGKMGWWVESTVFPYEPSTHVHQAKPVDDGHGHAH